MKKYAVILICLLSCVLCANADIDLITVNQSSQQTNSANAKLFQVSIVPRNAFQGDKILHVNIDFAATNQSPKSLGFLLLDGDIPLVTASISPQVQTNGVVRFSLDLHNSMTSKCFLDYFEDDTDPDFNVAMGTIYKIDVGSYYKQGETTSNKPLKNTLQ
jgi:hypothetical protein